MVNKVFLLGNLGRDPEIKYFDEHSAVTSFTLATNETYVDKTGARVTQTEWHNIKVSRTNLAKVAEQYLKKGDLIYLEGKIKSRSYDDKEGHKKYITEIIVESFKMLNKKSGHDQEQSEERSESKSGNPFPESQMNDDLPF